MDFNEDERPYTDSTEQLSICLSRVFIEVPEGLVVEPIVGQVSCPLKGI